MVNIVLRFNTLDNQKQGRTIAVHVAARWRDDGEFEKFRRFEMYQKKKNYIKW